MKRKLCGLECVTVLAVYLLFRQEGCLLVCELHQQDLGVLLYGLSMVSEVLRVLLRELYEQGCATVAYLVCSMSSILLLIVHELYLNGSATMTCACRHLLLLYELHKQGSDACNGVKCMRSGVLLLYGLLWREGVTAV